MTKFETVAAYTAHGYTIEVSWNGVVTMGGARYASIDAAKSSARLYAAARAERDSREANRGE